MEYIIVISTSVIAVVAVLGIYREYFVGLIFHPDPKFGETFFHRLPLIRTGKVGPGITTQAETHYFRLKIFNDGKRPAKDVEVLVTEVRKKNADEKYKPMPMLTPYSLRWTHSPEPSLPVIHPKSERHITLGSVVDPQYRASLALGYPPSLVKQGETIFDLEFTLKTTNHEYLLEIGEYEIDLQIVSSNYHKPRRATVTMNHTGKWFNSEDEMYTKGVKITINKD